MARHFRNLAAFGLGLALSAPPAIAQEEEGVVAAADACALAALELHAPPELAALIGEMAQAPLEATLTVDLEDVDVRTALEIVARASDGNVVLASNVRGKVTISLASVPWQEAVARVAECVGARVVPVDIGNGYELLRVVPVPPAEPELHTRTFMLVEESSCAEYRRWREGSFSLQSGNDDWGADGSLLTAQPRAASALIDLLPAVTASLTKHGAFEFDDDACRIVVTDTQEALDAIAGLLRERGVLEPQSPQSKPSAVPSLPAAGNGEAGGAPDLNR